MDELLETPAAPSVGSISLYSKDGSVYKLLPDGTESELGVSNAFVNMDGGAARCVYSGIDSIEAGGA